MAFVKSLLRFAILLIYVFNTVAIPSKQFSCPEVCDCYLSKINWVTDCTNKNLTYIPHNGLDLDTYILNMNDNYLSELEPFPPSIKIWTLQLSNNLLTEIKNSTFVGLHHILNIDLSNNLISYVEPLSFNDNKGLITIDLHGNQFVEVNDTFLISNVLLNLNLANCRITNISPYFFANIRNLITLDLSGNSIEELKAQTFNPLTSLKHLILNDCNISYISIHAFIGLKNLTRLELARNKVKSDVNWSLVLRFSSRLDYLDLRKAGIAELSFDIFANNIWLRNLVLAENQLSGPHMGVTLGKNLIYLDFLDLSNCGLNVPISGNAFAHATKLHTLILSGNHLISTNLSAVFLPLVNLMKLSLRDCGLNRLTINTFKHLTHIKELDISKNPSISNNDDSLIFLSILKSLEYLDVGYCNLEEISATIFSKMFNLKTLILTGNKLKFLEQGSLQNLKGLKVLELNNCGLTSLSNILFFDDFPYYPNLEELRISGNPIQTPTHIILYKFHMVNLNNLDMSKCNLSYLPQEYFISTPNLKQLLLNDNKLKGDYKNMKFMKHLSNIVDLNLSFNNMTSIEPNVFDYNDRLVSLKLIGNPWICDCYIVDMTNWAEAIKLNIDVLNGSTNVYFYLNHEKTRYSTCINDPNTTPITKSGIQSNVSFKRHQDANFTWQKFVRDANCQPITISIFG